MRLGAAACADGLWVWSAAAAADTGAARGQEGERREEAEQARATGQAAKAVAARVEDEGVATLEEGEKRYKIRILMFFWIVGGLNIFGRPFFVPSPCCSRASH